MSTSDRCIIDTYYAKSKMLGMPYFKIEEQSNEYWVTGIENYNYEDTLNLFVPEVIIGIKARLFEEYRVKNIIIRATGDTKALKYIEGLFYECNVQYVQFIRKFVNRRQV